MIQTSLKRQKFPYHYTEFTENDISQFQPNQAMTVREILSKYANGTISAVAQELQYTEDLPDLRGLDIVELEAWKAENKQMIKELQQDIKDIEAEKKSRKKEINNELLNKQENELPSSGD